MTIRSCLLLVAFVALPSVADAQTVVLDGEHLTASQVVAIARDGAAVRLSDGAVARSRAAYGLLIEAAVEGIPVYWFDRGDGARRQVDIFKGDPLSAVNEPVLVAGQEDAFRRGAVAGYGPVYDVATVRAAMAIRANGMTYDAASPQLTAMLPKLLNAGVTPVVYRDGSVGEGDLVQLGNVGATMVGAGDAFYRGRRMPAAQALRLAGIAPLVPGVDDATALTSSNSVTDALAAFVVYDAERSLRWADVTYAMDLLGMNSSVTPIALDVQAARPVPAIQAEARRVATLLRGSYLYGADPDRIIQDPESLRASSQRQGTAWSAWERLRDALDLQMNSSDHNPAVLVGASPSDGWDMATPEMMRFYVKGGPRSGGMHGYVLSDANWDPSPLVDDVESFTIALADMDVAVAQRMQRFTSPFFTVVSANDVLHLPGYPPLQDYADYLGGDLWGRIAGDAVPVAPTGTALVGTVEDLQAQGQLKAYRAIDAVEATDGLLGMDLLVGAYWMDVRAAQNPARTFGAVPTAVRRALRSVVPLERSGAPPVPNGVAATTFMHDHPASDFTGGRP